jgi:hypothetical protein
MDQNTDILEAIKDQTVSDPLGEVTRAERKALLLVSLISVAIAKGGLVLKEIPALGITLSPSEILSLLYLLIAVLLYYLVGFSIYGLSDLKKRKATLTAALARPQALAKSMLEKHKEQFPPQSGNSQGKQPVDLEQLKPLFALSGYARIANEVQKFATIRIFYDFYLPSIVGIASLITVLVETRQYPGSRLITAAIAVAVSVLLIVYFWHQRAAIRHWVGVRRHKIQVWKFKRVTEKLKTQPQDPLKREKLKAQFEKAFKKTLEGPWV